MGPLSATAAVTSCESFRTLLDNVAKFGGGIITAVAVIIFIIAAYYFLFAGGSEEGATKGRQLLTYGIVGIIVALIAFTLPSLVGNLTGLRLENCPRAVPVN
ncbi:MAG: hypothetical protein Q8R35_02575 [bacterium]|nr:hypothetical protein [bacterium]